MFSPVSTQLLSISPLLYLLSSQVLPWYVIHPNFNLFPTSLSQSSLFSSPSPLLCRLLSSQPCLGMSSIRTLTFFQQVDQSPLFSSLLLSISSPLPPPVLTVLPQYVIHSNFNLFSTSLSQSPLFSSPSPLLCHLLSSESCLSTSSIRTLTFFQQVNLLSSPLCLLFVSSPLPPPLLTVLPWYVIH